LYDLNQVIFLLKKSFDLNRDLNQWFKSPWFKSANRAKNPCFLVYYAKHKENNGNIFAQSEILIIADKDSFPRIFTNPVGINSRY